MKREITAGLAGAVLVLGGVALLRGDRVGAQTGETGSKPRTVTAQGHAVLTTRPDSARLFFQIVTSASTVAEARSRNATQMNRVRTALTNLRIPELRTKSSDLDINPIYTSNPNTPSKLTGFKVIHTFTVRFNHNDPEKLGEWSGKVLDTATNAGVNSVQGITFFREDDRDVRRKAMEQAVADAMENAKSLAKGAGRTVLGPIEIQGTPDYGYSQSMNNIQVQSRMGAGEASSLVAGDIQVNCSAQVICTF